MAAVEVKNLTIAYGERVIIKNYSLAVDSSEAVLIRGPSGCGKSTLLNAVCGLIPNSINAEINSV